MNKTSKIVMMMSINSALSMTLFAGQIWNGKHAEDWADNKTFLMKALCANAYPGQTSPIPLVNAPQIQAELANGLSYENGVKNTSGILLEDFSSSGGWFGSSTKLTFNAIVPLVVPENKLGEYPTVAARFKEMPEDMKKSYLKDPGWRTYMVEVKGCTITVPAE